MSDREQTDVLEVSKFTFDDLRERLSVKGRCPAVLAIHDDGTNRPRLRIGNTYILQELNQYEQAKLRKLVLCNTRGNFKRGEERIVAYYACGTSVADCMRRINAADKFAHKTPREMRTFGGKCWGAAMEGVPVEPGVWVQRRDLGPVEKIA